MHVCNVIDCCVDNTGDGTAWPLKNISFSIEWAPPSAPPRPTAAAPAWLL